MSAHFGPELFQFLRDLKVNNEREWFKARKELYESSVKDPLLTFISDLGPHLRKISPDFLADPRPVGGSLFRIYRDTRFGKDKSPYKTHAAAHFRHRQAKDVHAPGYYLHLEPGSVFFGAGIWRPDSKSVKAIRESLVERPEEWRKMLVRKAFKERLTFEGESLKRPPRGFDAEHPLIDDLKRKDFIVTEQHDEEAAIGDDFLDRFVDFAKAASPLQRFLTQALGL